MSRLRRHLSPALFVSCIALLAALGGTGYAAMAPPPNSVGTKQLKNGAVVASKVKLRSLLARNFKRGELPRGPRGRQGARGLTGAAGAQGPSGAAGAKGDPATRLFGTVKNSVTGGVDLGPSSGVIGMPLKTATGVYLLTFNQDINNCAVLASPGATGGNAETAGMAAAAATTPRNVTVHTFNPGGGALDLDFTVAVFC
jgi:hypothetical protein